MNGNWGTGVKAKGSVVFGLTLSAIASTAHAYEFGFSGAVQAPGIVLGASAEAPPPGLYGFNQVFTYQGR